MLQLSSKHRVLKKYELSKAELEQLMQEALGVASMDDYFSRSPKIPTIKSGDIVSGKVISLKNDWVILDVGHKYEGFLPYDESGYVNEDLDLGDEVKCLVVKISDNGTFHLTRRGVEQMVKNQEIAAMLAVGDRIVGRLLNTTDEGWIVDVGGLHALLPSASEHLVGSPDELVNQEIEADVESISGSEVVLTRDAFAEEVKKLAKYHFITNLEIDDLVEGVVKNITDFGCFIQVDAGIIGLCHSSDLGNEDLHVGRKVKARVLKIDRDKGRVSLGIRQVTEPSWAELVSKYQVDQKVTVEVKSIVPFGAFVDVEPGVSGLIHVSDLSWSDHVKHPKEVFSEGDVVEVVVLGIDVEKQHISLGLKQATPDPWLTVDDRYLAGSEVEGTVTNKTKFGIFIELEKGVEGLAHHTLTSRDLRAGDTVPVTVMRVDSARKKISLAIED